MSHPHTCRYLLVGFLSNLRVSIQAERFALPSPDRVPRLSLTPPIILSFFPWYLSIPFTVPMLMSGPKGNESITHSSPIFIISIFNDITKRRGTIEKKYRPRDDHVRIRSDPTGDWYCSPPFPFPRIA